MAIERPIATPIKREERTDQVIIDCPPGQGYTVTVIRVTRDTYQDNTTAEVSRRSLVRPMSDLVKDSQAAQLLVTLPPIFDRWAQEDDARAV